MNYSSFGMNHVPIYFLLFLITVGFLVIYSSPYIDQQWAIIPYDNITKLFYGETHTWCLVIYYSVNVATFILIVTPLVLLILSRRKNLQFDIKRLLLISYLSLAIGPGIIVNSLFKEHWGRARPYQVIRDHKPFSLPIEPHFNRPTDNSFPSGHVSIGAFLGVPFIAARRRKIGIALSFLGAVIVGVVRWLQGGHYPTDIMMAAIIVWFVAASVTLLVDKYFIHKRS